jgi:hypothetical protein
VTRAKGHTRTSRLPARPPHIPRLGAVHELSEHHPYDRPLGDIADLGGGGRDHDQQDDEQREF